MGKGCQERKAVEEGEIFDSPENTEKPSEWGESVSSKAERKRTSSRRTLVIMLIFLVLIGALIGLSVSVAMSSLSSPGFSYVCPDTWLGFRGKCYYFSINESDWHSSQKSCEAVGASLADVSSEDELIFIKRYKGPANHWFGLRKEGDESWRWTNGTAFNNWFEVRGGGRCAYINEKRVSSSLCRTSKNWVCSRPDSYVLWKGNKNP
ncbi:C-type lectin domain family 2 member D-like [Rhea pennata]|uniref:C-type lectin domain family 2 member D-like n=1 Tax=Rhea pennata TaxID=8795 RepID=UPI002E26CCEA